MSKMDRELRTSIVNYYNARAGEYEEIYTLGKLGKRPVSISDPAIYKAEAKALSKLINRFCHGKHIDIACGTGFWLPFYAQNCTKITLLDQSQQMLSMCQRKIRSLEIEDKCSLLCEDVFQHRFEPMAFDSALAGFFLSHLTPKLEGRFFQILKTILTPGGRFLIIDSIWSTERAKHQKKEGWQERTLNDGSRFDIYKRYFDKGDFRVMEGEYGFHLSILHAGRAFFAVTGGFTC